MQIQNSRFKVLSATLVLALSITPQMFAQQSSPQSPAQQPPETAQQPQQQQNTQPESQTTPQPATPADQTQPASPQATGAQTAPPQTNSTTVNPSQGPLQPVTTYPNANDQEKDQEPAASTPQTTNTPDAPKPKQQPSQPVGAATAERVPTAGGAAAKPAGSAIAPAKQHQTRSLLIKIGAIAAAGAALGTVYALSRGTSSTPPNAGIGTPK